MNWAGLYPDMSGDEYHLEKDHISKTGLDRIAKSPLHFKEEIREETANFATGKATHHYILEGDSFNDHYHITPNIRRGTKEWKGLAEEHAGKELIKEQDFEAVRNMHDAVWNHPEAKTILSRDGYFEHSIFAEINGVKVKCRPDWFDDIGIVTDLKTTVDASPEKFMKSIWNYRYHVQAAFYIDVMKAAGIKAEYFAFIAVEKTSPFAVCVFVMGDAAIDAGRQEYQKDLETYKRCQESGIWPGYNDNEIIEVQVPRWLEMRLQEG